jgi:hypothetical protein
VFPYRRKQRFMRQEAWRFARYSTPNQAQKG